MLAAQCTLYLARPLSTAEQSEVQILLADIRDERLRRGVDSFLQPSDIFGLLINSSLSFLHGKGTQNDTLRQLLGLVGQNLQLDEVLQGKVDILQHKKRQKRTVLSTAALTVLKYGLPYLLTESDDMLENLAAKMKGRFITPDPQSNLEKSRGLAEHLTHVFGNNGIKVELQSDRIKLQFSEDKSFIHPPKEDVVISPQLLQELELATDKFLYFEKNLKELFPRSLLARLWPQLQTTVRDQSKVFYVLKRAKSFYKLSFFFEGVLQGESVTTYKFQALPSKRIKNKYFTHKIANLTLDLSDKARYETRGGSFQCQRALISNLATQIGDFCQEQETSFGSILEGLKMGSVGFFIVKGKVNLHYSCPGDTPQVLTLVAELNVLLVSDYCYLYIQLASGRQWTRVGIQLNGEVSDPLERIKVLYILKYDVWGDTHFNTKVRVAVISLTIALSLLALLVLGVMFGIWRFKRKVGGKIVQAYWEKDQEGKEQARIEFSSPSLSHTPYRRESRVDQFEDDRLETLPKLGGKAGKSLLTNIVSKAQIGRQRAPDETFDHIPVEQIFPNVSRWEYEDSGITSVGDGFSPSYTQEDSFPGRKIAQYATVRKKNFSPVSHHQ